VFIHSKWIYHCRTNSGVAEQRRIIAKEFLMQTRDCLGAETYLVLANNLKMFHKKEISITQLKDNIIKILVGWPDLIKRFNDFLPNSLRAAVS
jgi:histone deacetylase complex regulatory component SIN3